MEKNGLTEPVLWTIQQASDATGLSISLLYRDARLGRLPGAVRVGRAVRVHRETFMARLAALATAEPGLTGQW